jgi:hypothetical protein
MFRGKDLHRALKSEILGRTSAGDPGMELVLARMQYGKDDQAVGLHARPNSYTSSGLQATDFLSLLGFTRNACSIVPPECYVAEVEATFDLQRFPSAVGDAFRALHQAEQHLSACGFLLPQTEGWGFFYGRPSTGRTHEATWGGDGHTAMKTESMKRSEDESFSYAFTWREAEDGKGWVIHYKPKHPPMAEDVHAAFNLLKLRTFQECPEFNFDPCWWRSFPRRGDELGAAEGPHRAFDAHSQNFTTGLKQIVEAHEKMRPFELSLLPSVAATRRSTIPVSSRALPRPPVPAPSANSELRAASDPRFRYDIAISFAGTQRPLAASLAGILKNADFYPEQLWGKDLTVFFDEVFRKNSRFCVMFVSKEYAERIWTTRERQSAMARAVEERGSEYILPLQVEKVEIPGLLPTIGYVSLEGRTIEDVAELLTKKLRPSQRA